MKRSQKIASGAVAAVLAAAAVFTGTFAWRNTFATAPVLRAVGTLNPGGRLHDDFNGESKHVYVENFTDPGSGENIYARIRLDEYMEFGKTAGRKDGSGDAVRPLVPGTSINNPAGWTTHIPGETVFSDYWKFETGGSTVYMPTFNRDKDSTLADINGTYHGADPDDDVHFDDYVEYSEGDTLTAPARYDADDNAYDEGDEAVENANYVLVEETHTAAHTLGATVLTMAEWKASGGQRGSFWVWDTDGWCYWANPIAPGTATGCLLNAVKPASQPGNTWYYAINVVAQFITADDAGRNSDTGFFTGGVAPTDDAIELLNIIGVNTDYTGVINVTPYAGSSFVELGYPLAFNASVFVPGADPADQHVTWSVDGNTDPATTIDENGVLTIGPGETVGEFLTVTAFSPRYGLTGEASVEITVNGAVVVTPANGVPESQLGVPKQFDAATSVPAYAGTVDQSVIWSITGNEDPNTTIDENGVLTVGPDEPQNNVLTVTATSQVYGLLGSYSFEYTLPLAVNAIEPTENTTNTTIVMDGVEYYVLYKDTDNNRALLLTKIQQADISMNGYSNSHESKASRWNIATSRSWLNGTWLNSKTELKKYIIPVTISTQDRTKNNSYYNTTDKVFLLSAADIAGKKDNGRYTVQDELDPRAYTVVDGDGNGVILGSAIPDNLGYLTWLRSPAYVEKNEKNKWGYMLLKTDGSFFEMDGHSGIKCYVRPAMWVDISQPEAEELEP